MSTVRWLLVLVENEIFVTSKRACGVSSCHLPRVPPRRCSVPGIITQLLFYNIRLMSSPDAPRAPPLYKSDINFGEFLWWYICFLDLLQQLGKLSRSWRINKTESGAEPHTSPHIRTGAAEQPWRRVAVSGARALVCPVSGDNGTDAVLSDDALLQICQMSWWQEWEEGFSIYISTLKYYR